MSGPGSGAWSRFAGIATGLVANDVSVSVLGGTQHEEPLTELGLHSWTGHLTGPTPGSRHLGSRRIEQFVQANHLDVVHIEAPPFLPIRGAKALGAIHDLRNFHKPVTSLRTSGAIYQRFVLKRHRKNVDAWLALSQSAAQEIHSRLSIPASKIYEVPPVVEVPPRSHLTRVPSRYVLALGHLEERKNLQVLVRAACSPRWPRGVELVIAGEDHGALAGLVELASSAVVPVRFLGRVSDLRKFELLAAAQLVAIPSTVEGFGIVAVEAPLSGSPALVSDCTALVELAATGSAIVSVHDPEAWAQRVANVCESVDFRTDILEAQEANAKQFSRQAVTEKLLTIYNLLLG